MESAHVKSAAQPVGLSEPVGLQAMNTVIVHTWSDTERPQSVTTDTPFCTPSEDVASVESSTGMRGLLQSTAIYLTSLRS